MIAISFYTANGKYPALASRLRKSCERFDLRHKIVEAPQQDCWHRTINLKPGFILQSLLDAREPVLWLDCDCEIRQPPKLLSNVAMTGTDFAVYNWQAHGDYDGSEITNSGGVSYWAYTAPVLDLLIRWQFACQNNPLAVDDETLDYVWKHFRPPVKPLWLPKEYNWMWSNGPQDPVIERAFGPVPDDCVIWHDYVGGKHGEAA